jgi:hypothetical protein
VGDRQCSLTLRPPQSYLLEAGLRWAGSSRISRSAVAQYPRSRFASVSLIFGLPALRNNLEPSVPPVGVFGDNVAFIWAELIVAVSTVVVWTWIVKSRYRN